MLGEKADIAKPGAWSWLGMYLAPTRFMSAQTGSGNARAAAPGRPKQGPTTGHAEASSRPREGRTP